MIIPVGTGQVNFLFGGAGCPTGAQCTLGFDNEVAAMTAQQAADAWATLWNNNIQPEISDQVTFLGTLVKLGPNTSGPSAVSPASIAGGDSGDSGAAAVAFLVRKITPLGGRKGRGRMFVPGVDEASVLPGGTINGTKTGLLDSAFSDLLADAQSLDLNPLLLHNDATTPSEITSFSIDSIVATQRRRQRR